MIHIRLCTAGISLLLLLAAPLAATTPPASGPDLAESVGVSFPAGSESSVVLEKDGKRYLIDVSTKTVTELGALSAVTESAMLFAKNCAACHGTGGKGMKSIGTPDFTNPAFQKSVNANEMRTAIEKGKGSRMPAWSGKLTNEEISALVTYIRSLSAAPNVILASTGGNSAQQINTKIYQPGDDVLMSLPTGRLTERHGVYVNFTHRFPYQPAFTGPAEGATLFGLDNVAVASLGVRYGVTDRFSVSAFRSPSLVNRPIQLMAGYNVLEEGKDNPLNLMVRVSIEGQNNFQKNFTENIEAILSKSITSRAQFYIVPTFNFNDRLLRQPVTFASSSILSQPGVNSFSLGAGVAVDVRPSIALLAEVIPTLLNRRALEIPHPVFSFGIQKKIYRHAFTLGLSTSPGTTVSQRAATNVSFLSQPGAGTLPGLFIAFDLTRQIK